MPTLELTLQRQTDSGYPVAASLTRPGGFLPLRREGMLNLDIPALSELQYDPLAYGTVLGKTLFVDEIRDTFREGLSGGEPLRVLLSIEDPDLRALDWHRLAAPMDGGRWRFLASQQNTPFSLSIPSPASAHFPALGRRDLRALILVAGPESLSGDYKLAPFDVAATIASIQAALGDIPCDILPNPSLDALCAALTATPYTLLHLVCHGAVNQSGETILYFPKDSKGGPTPATDLLDRLGSLARLPHFAFISACESALPQNGLGSLAGRLVRELGLPAVLAMTDRVSIATASAIAAPFYAHLYQHGQPDLALAQSLAGLQGKHDLTVPAIFSRLGDRPLFDDNSERALTEKELEFGLAKLAESLPERAPVMDSLLDSLTRRLRSTLGADSKSLSESSRTERKETLDQLNSLSLEALDLSFNALCLDKKIPDYDSRSPFRGLESFRPEDAAYFFGRETLTRKLVQKLNEHNFLTVLGASGSGKSSLVMAGLIPALNVPYAVFRPGAEPLSELDKALQVGPKLLVVDQFEELFTLSAREQRAEFISRLLEQVHKIRVVITMRADFLGEVAPFKSLKDEVQNHQEIIPPMDEAELRRAMEGQAACVGLRFESDLSQQMLDDVSGEPGAMPLLQHALWTLWTRRHGRWLRADEYRAFGGVKQAIASTAEAVFARCTDFEKERLRDIFLRLTRLDESADGRDTRRRVLLRDLIPADSDPESTKLLIKQLADARLVVVTGDEVEVAHEALIRHWERLRTWLNDDRDNLRLREGVSDDARRWDNATRDETLLNHRGQRLELALAMSKTPRYRLNPVEQAYLHGCVELMEREKAAAGRRKKYTIAGVSMALMTIIVILTGWGITTKQQIKIAQTAQANAEYAKETAVSEASSRATAQVNSDLQKSEAEKQAKIALARQLAAQAQMLGLDQSTTAVQSSMLAIESAKLYSGLEANIAISRYLRLIPRSEKALFHRGVVNDVKYTPDGLYIISGGTDQQVRIWDANTGKKIIQLQHDGIVNKIAIDPVGKYVASASSDHTVKIWNILTWREIHSFPHSSSVNHLSISKDGTLIVTADSQNNITVWDVEAGQKVFQSSLDKPIHSIDISADKNYVVAGGDDQIAHVWDISSQSEIFHITHNDFVYSVAFSADGMYVASGAGWRDQTVRVQEIATKTEITRLEDIGEISTIKFSPNGTFLATLSSDYIIRIWEIPGGNLITSMQHDPSSVVDFLEFSPTGNFIISSSRGGTAVVWDTWTGEKIAIMSQKDTITVASFSPDEQYIVAGDLYGEIWIWNIMSVLGEIGARSESAIRTAIIDPQDRFFITVSDKTINVQSLLAQRQISSMSHVDGISSVSLSPDGNSIASTSYDYTVRIWDVLTGQELFHKELINSMATSVDFSPDGKYILVGYYDQISRIWDISTGSEVARFVCMNMNAANFVSFSPDGKLAFTGCRFDAGYIWDVSTGEQISYAKGWFYGGNAMFSPDNRYMASAISGSPSDAVVWDILSGKELFRINHKDNVAFVTFSPSGNFIASASYDHTIKVWDVHNRKKVLTLFHESGVTSLDFSADENFLVSGSVDKTVRVWDLNSKQEVARYFHSGAITSVSFSPTGKYIISSSLDKTARAWPWRIEDLIEEACLRSPRNLSRTEWQQYIGDILPYQAVCPNLPLEP